jgi:hypothetical protein
MVPPFLFGSWDGQWTVTMIHQVAALRLEVAKAQEERVGRPTGTAPCRLNGAAKVENPAVNLEIGGLVLRNLSEIRV